MRYRLLAAVFSVCLAATAGTLSVDQLFSFIQSSVQSIKEGKQTDKETADFLAGAKLTQRLDDRSVEQMESLGIGPRTLAALRRLRDRSQALPAANAIEPPAPPRQEPPPSSAEQAAIINEVRAYALDYTKNLPDFICTEVTRRFAAPPPGTRYGGSADSEPSWQSQDTLTVRLSFFEQKEEYKPIMVNDRITTQDYKSLGGSLVSGDFGSMMKEIFEPVSQARFEWDHWGTLRSKKAMAFAYRVEQAHSQWHITYGGQLDIVPAYHGLVYVDAKSHEVVRVTLEAENLPASFPVKLAQTILDYDYQELSGHLFLLPIKDLTLMRADDYLSKNETEFRMYRKYTAESELKFDTETPEPLPPEKTKETPATAPPPPPPAKTKETPATTPPPARKN